MKARIELTEAVVRKAIEQGKPTSMTKLAHSLGYRGSVSSSLTRKFRALIPGIDTLLKGAADASPDAAGAANPGVAGKAAGTTAGTTVAGAGKSPKGEPKGSRPEAANGAAKPAKAKRKWPRDPRNPFRQLSAYAACYDILASHRDGLPRARLVELLAAATGKDARHAGYDAQVVLSARPNEDGLNNNESPRNRSCRPGFWVQRTNGHVKLMVD